MQRINSKTVVSRKEHICNLCNDKIEKGHKYRTQFNKLDGDTYTFKNHIHCGEIASRLKMYGECGYGLTDEIFQETIREEFVFLQELHNSEVFNYEHYRYPSFTEQLDYVCSYHYNSDEYEKYLAEMSSNWSRGIGFI